MRTDALNYRELGYPDVFLDGQWIDPRDISYADSDTGEVAFFRYSDPVRRSCIAKDLMKNGSIPLDIKRGDVSIVVGQSRLMPEWNSTSKEMSGSIVTDD